MKEETRRTISIRWIVSGGAVALTAIAVLAVSFVGERNAQSMLTRELQTRLIVEARNLALTSSRALLSEFPELTLAPIIAEMTADEARLDQTAVVDLDGNIRGHANARRIGEKYTLPQQAVPLRTAAGLHAGEQVYVSDELLIAVAPVKHPQGHTIGSAYVSFPREYVSAVLAEVRRKQLILAACMLAAGLLLAPLLMAHLLRPVSALRAGLERIGRGDLDTPVRLRDRTEFGLLAHTMNRMSRGLREAQEQKAERERLSHEVELARQIQSSLLPNEDFHAGSFRIVGAHRAAAEVGGDLWDVFPLEDGRTGLAIADVSGKGLAGCLVTSMLSALLRAFRNEESSPAALLARLERHLPLRSGTFITMFYGILDPVDGSLTFASAAHSPLLVKRAAGGRTEWYPTKGIPIGAVKGGALAKTLSDERLVLQPGDVLVQYTDGINEAFDPDENQFGFERIEKAVGASRTVGGATVIDGIRRDLEAWRGIQPPHDDETLLVVLHEGAAVGPSASDEPDPLRVLERARAVGRHLSVAADLDHLTALREFVAGCAGFEHADASTRTIAETALYEVCANVIEHGFGRSAGAPLDLWWVPCDATDPLSCRFVVVDRAAPFSPEPGSRLDFHDSAVRRRGRGLGLEIIREAMRHVSYHPGTAAGNVTILAFDPSRSRMEEVSHE